MNEFCGRRSNTDERVANLCMMKVIKLFRYLAALCGLVLAGLLGTGCQTESVPGAQTTGAGAFADVPGFPSGPAPGETRGPIITDQIGIGDSLLISFNDLNPPQPAMEQVVREDGTITLLLNKTFNAAGKSRGKLEEEIRAFYVPDYYKQMTVNIKRSDLFYIVSGEVKSPNRQLYLGPTSVLRAVASANGFTDFANKRKVFLIRPGKKREVVDCIKALTDPSQDLPVYPGDIVHVKRRIF